VDACYVRCNGEKRELVTDEDTTTEEGRMMTDGGVTVDDDPDPEVDYSEEDLRKRFSEVVQGRAQKSKVLHLPDPEASELTPRCDRNTSNGWREVSVKTIPMGHRSFCSYCVERFHEDPREKYGDAMESDW